MSWQIGTSKDLNLILDFLLDREWECIQILSEIIKDKKIVFPHKRDAIFLICQGSGSKIDALILITSKGLIYPYFKDSLFYNKACFDDLIKITTKVKFTIHGVIGLSNDVNNFHRIIHKRVRGINNYKLMYRDSSDYFQIKNPTNITKANVNDLKKLIELEYEYQLEEVLLNKTDLNKRAIHENFKKKLSKEDIYYISDTKGSPVSKGGTTYRSLNFTLIGGVFTEKKLRNKGYSTQLLKGLINHQLSLGYKSALFVKDNNLAAIHLYKKLGFNNPQSYQINYYYN